MWHKRHRQDDPLAPPGKRLRDNIADLYSSGEVAGDRAQSLLDDAGQFADSMGSHELQDLRTARAEGKNKDRTSEGDFFAEAGGPVSIWQLSGPGPRSRSKRCPRGLLFFFLMR